MIVITIISLLSCALIAAVVFTKSRNVAWVSLAAVMITTWLAPGQAYTILPELFPSPKELLIAALCLATVTRTVRDRENRNAIQFSFLDILMLAWVLVPFISAETNGQSASEAIKASSDIFFPWIPGYIIGRVVFTIKPNPRTLLKTVAFISLLVSPIALAETFIRPPLLADLYGQAQSNTNHRFPLILNRFGPMGYRPEMTNYQLSTAFLFCISALSLFAILLQDMPIKFRGKSGANGIEACETDLNLTSTSYITQRFWLNGLVNNRVFLCIGFAALLFTSVSCRSVGTFALLIGGAVLLLLLLVPKTRWLSIAPLILSIAYVVSRVFNLWDPYAIADVNNKDSSPSGAIGKTWSLWFRWHQEDRVMIAIQDHLYFGLGSSIRRAWTNTGIPDLYWIDSNWAFILARHGYVGLLTWITILCFAMAKLVSHTRNRPDYLCLLFMGVVIGIYAIDSTLNPTPPTLVAFFIGCIASMRTHVSTAEA